MGACTVVVSEVTVFGNKAVAFGSIHGSATYATGGETFTAAQLGLNSVDQLSIFPGFLAGSPNQAYVPVADLTNLKMLLFGLAAAPSAGDPLTEAGSTNDVSGYVCNYIAYGTP